jgi:hypothetical protein
MILSRGEPHRQDRAVWLGRQDSNLGMAESKSAALPLGYAPSRRIVSVHAGILPRHVTQDFQETRHVPRSAYWASGRLMRCAGGRVNAGPAKETQTRAPVSRSSVPAGWLIEFLRPAPAGAGEEERGRETRSKASAQDQALGPHPPPFGIQMGEDWSITPPCGGVRTDTHPARSAQATFGPDAFLGWKRPRASSAPIDAARHFLTLPSLSNCDT